MLFSQSSLKKTMLVMPDGRIFITVLCDEKWNGDIFVTRDGRKIYQRTLYKYDHYCNSKLRLSRFGVNHQNHIFQNLLQVRLEDVWEKFQRDTSNEPDIISVEKKGNPEKTDLLVTRILFGIGYEVEKKYYDLDNNESPINLDSLPTGEWATFILKKKVELKSPVIPNLRRRGVQDNGGAGTTRGRPNDIDTSQQQDQQNRNNFVNANNNNHNNLAMDEDGSVFLSPTNHY
mmetsp:Transcript_11235/g.10916  ORF Transcript_11235/g.10916 Transcript_11235/m.10916 type:complete len:231 (-) Transcript_11235:231-923(-)